MTKRILFVWRHNNDFDSTLPVVHAAANSQDFGEVFVYVSSEELLWRADFRAGILDDMPGLRVFDIWSLIGRPWGAVARRICAFFGMSRGPLRKLLPKAARAIIGRSAWRKRLETALDDIDPALIAFDWVDVGYERDNKGPWGIKTIAEWARRKQRPFVGLMHGLSLASFPNATNAMSPDFSRLYIESDFRLTQMTESGYPADKLCVGGAPRSDRAWVEFLGQRLEAQGLVKRDAERKTIVFFATKLVYDYDFERLIDWLCRLAAIPGIRLIVQPHPRGQGRSGFRRLAKYPSCVIDMSTPASILIREADIVSTLVSSVVCEAVTLGIPLLYPRFLNTIATRFDEEGACITIDRLEDTEAAVKRCLDEGVSKDAYERFLNNHVWGGRTSPIAATLADMVAIANS